MSETMPYSKHFVQVAGRKIAYIDEGAGKPIVLLHGNPTSSYLWRDVIPHLVDSGRVLVPDLIGQGNSEKLPADEGPDRYGFLTAYGYLDAWLARMGIDSDVTLVMHDWGSGLGFHWASQHPTAVKAMAYMEAIVTPLGWDDWPESARGIFQGFRSEKGEELILQRNLFVEAVLPSAVMRELSKAEMDAYRAPFIAEEDRQVTLNWPRSIPIEGEPADMVALVEAYGRWMEQSDAIPKLFVNAEPGSILVGRQREYCRSWPNQEEVTVPGLHFLQEDSAEEIGKAIAQWLARRVDQ